MTFEEFFKKKRIDLDALQAAEPALFSEFKTHFEQMGEKVSTILKNTGLINCALYM